MTTLRHDDWARLWLAELERRNGRSLPDPSLVRDRLGRALERTEPQHARAEDGSQAFAGRAEHRHPLTGQSEIVLSNLAADGPEALRDLLAALPDGGSATLETAGTPGKETAAVLREASFAPHVLTLRHLTDPDALLAEGPLDIHPVCPAEHDFVYDCLATALGRGLQDESAATDLREWARSRFRLTDPSFCLVGTLDGRPVCHGLGTPRPDRYTDTKVLYVVDVFVIPEEHARGFSRTVSTTLLRLAAERGHRVLESDLVIGPNSDRLLDGLRRAGWVPDRLRWRRTAVVGAR
ncbi:GNAT family N-acetyltransferase [Streptomyces sp. NPDC054804]